MRKMNESIVFGFSKHEFHCILILHHFATTGGVHEFTTDFGRDTGMNLDTDEVQERVLLFRCDIRLVSIQFSDIM